MINRQNGNFTVILNEIVNNKKLSAKAKGIYLYLQSKKDGWQFYESEIITNFTDGQRSIRAGLQELIDSGLLLKYQPSGQGFQKALWILNPTKQDYKEYGLAFRADTKRDNTKCADTKSTTNNTNKNKTNSNNTNTKEIVATAPKSPSSKKKVMFNDEDMGLAITMYQNLLAMNGGFKKPDLEKWANEFRLMRQIDHRTPEKMDTFLRLLATGTERLWEFWRGNILSPNSMRKNYDKVVTQYRKDEVDTKKVMNQNIPLSERMEAMADKMRA